MDNEKTNHLLVVEDDKLNQMVMEKYLEKEGP